MRQYLMMDERAMIDFHDAEVLESCSGEQDAWEAVKDWSEMNGVLFFIPEDAGQEPRMVWLSKEEAEAAARKHRHPGYHARAIIRGRWGAETKRRYPLFYAELEKMVAEVRQPGAARDV